LARYSTGAARGRPVSEAKRNAVALAIAAANDLKAMVAVLRGMPELRVTEAELKNNKVPALALIGERDPLKVFADQMAAVTTNLEESDRFGRRPFLDAGRSKASRPSRPSSTTHAQKRISSSAPPRQTLRYRVTSQVAALAGIR